jgi:hypothetical protein
MVLCAVSDSCVIYRDHRDTPGLTVAQVEAELEESVRTRMW